MRFIKSYALINSYLDSKFIVYVKTDDKSLKDG